MSCGSLAHVQGQDDCSRVCKCCLTSLINGEASESSLRVVGMLIGGLRFHHFLPLSASQKGIQKNLKEHNITEPHILAPVSGHMSQCDHISWSKQRKVNIKLIQHVNMLQLLLIAVPRNSTLLTMRPSLFRFFLTFRHPDMKSGPAVSFTLSLSLISLREDSWRRASPHLYNV